MKIDNIGCSLSPTQFPLTQASNNKRSLIYEEFEHIINILNKKINSIYYLCQFLGDQAGKIADKKTDCKAVGEITGKITDKKTDYEDEAAGIGEDGVDYRDFGPIEIRRNLIKKFL